MAKDDVGMRLILEAQTRDFTKALQQAQKDAETNTAAIEKRTSEMTERMSKDTAEAVSGMNNALSNFGAGLLKGALGTAAFAAAAQMVKALNDEIKAVGETAKLTGESVENISSIVNTGKLLGLGSKESLAGITSLAERLNEAKTEENSLTALLDANNIKYRDRKGEVISINEALLIASDLINRAGNEFEKIKIAEALGLSKEFAKSLEDGPRALQQAQDDADKLGGKISTELVEKANEFDKAWNRAWAEFGLQSNEVILSAKAGLSALVGYASEILAIYNKTSQGAKAQVLNGPTNSTVVDDGSGSFYAPVAPVPTARPSSRDIFGATKTASKSSSDSARQADRDAFEEFFLNQTKKNDLIRAEQSTIGLTTEARIRERAQVELNAEAEKIARQRGSELTAEEKAKVEQLIEARATEGQRLETLKTQYTDMLALQRASGQLLSGFMSDIVSGGKNAEQAIMNLTKRLADMVLQAAILGDGPLAGIMGTKSSVQGGVGGLIGALFGGGAGSSNTSNATLATGFGLFDSGGYTGRGSTTGVAGLVHGQEFVINAQATKRFFPLLEAINANRMPGYASGGFVGNRSGGSGLGLGSNVVVNITNNSKAGISQTETQTAGQKTLDIVVSDIVTKQVNTRGSDLRTSLAMQGGIREQRVRR